MSGLLRNILAFCIGLFSHGSKAASDVVVTSFWVTPFDSGIKVLKSDKYLQFAETAQVDYLLKVGQFFNVLRSGAGFVNVALLVKFSRPVPVFSRVWVETRLLYADDKCAYFSHALQVRGAQAAEVLVKMKFKKGGLTLAPAAFLCFNFAEVPAKVREWEPVLQVM
ncbi:MAG: thioesterase family protein [Pseudomonas sp.]